MRPVCLYFLLVSICKMFSFTFCWPCSISIHPCNENQFDVLFILSLFRQSTSTCFGHIYPQFISSVNLYMFRAYLSSVYFVRQPLHVSGIFILSLFRQSTSTCFGHICSPSSGVILYTYKNWYVLCLLGGRQSTKKHNTYQLLYIYSVPPDDGLQICPKHVEVDWRNILRINSA
jgi:hypothetical protein